MKTETVTTHELQDGDLITTHGALLRLRDRKVWKDFPSARPDYAPVITFNCDCENDGGTIPRNWLKRWVVQGNGLANWARVVS